VKGEGTRYLFLYLYIKVYKCSHKIERALYSALGYEIEVKDAHVVGWLHSIHKKLKTQ
jgi:hypothetical protein